MNTQRAIAQLELGSAEQVLSDLVELGEDMASDNGAAMRGDDYAFLRDTVPPVVLAEEADVCVVDLFCGAGGLTLGVVEACRALGKSVKIPLAVDFEEKAQAVFKANFPHANAIVGDVGDIFSAGPANDALTPAERALAKSIGAVDVLVGGPPCQGHSDLNNYSRRNDPKNSLYYLMARAAYVLKPRAILIENVLGARHDRSGVVDRTIKALADLGYDIDVATIDLVDIGVPQKRRRLVILATLKVENPGVANIVDAYRTSEKDLAWAIKDIEVPGFDSLVNTPSIPSKDNKKRIDYLFDNHVDDLPDRLRPPCHQHGNHTYKSVYGRLSWNQPSQTVTSGFYSMCMGRYVHPSQRRTLTAREAARLQFFPDYFTFEAAGSRTAIAKIIGNAVPPKLSFAIAHRLLAGPLQ